MTDRMINFLQNEKIILDEDVHKKLMRMMKSIDNEIDDCEKKKEALKRKVNQLLRRNAKLEEELQSWVGLGAKDDVDSLAESFSMLGTRQRSQGEEKSDRSKRQRREPPRVKRTRSYSADERSKRRRNNPKGIKRNRSSDYDSNNKKRKPQLRF